MNKTLPNKAFSLLALVFSMILLASCQTTTTTTATTSETKESAAGEDKPKSDVKGETRVAKEDTAETPSLDPDSQPAPAAGAAPAKETKVAEAPALAPAPAKEVQVAQAPASKPQPKPKQKPKKKPLSPDDPRSIIYLGADGKMAGTGDPNNMVSEAFKYGAGATAKSLTAPGLPKDKFGLIDWIAMVDQEIIKPIGSLKPGALEIPPFDMNVVIHAKGDFVNDVLFQHKTHTYWLSCEICHTGIFIMAKGKNNMTMQGITQGKWCGRCHGKVSFPLTDCNRCHSQPKETAEAKK